MTEHSDRIGAQISNNRYERSRSSGLYISPPVFGAVRFSVKEVNHVQRYSRGEVVVVASLPRVRIGCGRRRTQLGELR